MEKQIEKIIENGELLLSMTVVNLSPQKGRPLNMSDEVNYSISSELGSNSQKIAQHTKEIQKRHEKIGYWKEIILEFGSIDSSGRKNYTRFMVIENKEEK